MKAKAVVVFAVLALVSCFGRVSAWAAVPGDPHACCAGESSAPEQGPVVAECCAVPAAAAAVKPLAPELTFVVVAAPIPAPALSVECVEAAASGPPGPDALLSSVPARAPPLA